jgi:hypothetical protein
MTTHDKGSYEVDQAVARLAAAQEGIITRAQLDWSRMCRCRDPVHFGVHVDGGDRLYEVDAV